MTDEEVGELLARALTAGEGEVVDLIRKLVEERALKLAVEHFEWPHYFPPALPKGNPIVTGRVQLKDLQFAIRL